MDEWKIRWNSSFVCAAKSATYFVLFGVRELNREASGSDLCMLTKYKFEFRRFHLSVLSSPTFPLFSCPESQVTTKKRAGVSSVRFGSFDWVSVYLMYTYIFNLSVALDNLCIFSRRNVSTKHEILCAIHLYGVYCVSKVEIRRNKFRLRTSQLNSNSSQIACWLAGAGTGTRTISVS